MCALAATVCCGTDAFANGRRAKAEVAETLICSSRTPPSFSSDARPTRERGADARRFRFPFTGDGTEGVGVRVFAPPRLVEATGD